MKWQQSLQLLASLSDNLLLPGLSLPGSAFIPCWTFCCAHVQNLNSTLGGPSCNIRAFPKQPVGSVVTLRARKPSNVEAHLFPPTRCSYEGLGMLLLLQQHTQHPGTPRGAHLPRLRSDPHTHTSQLNGEAHFTRPKHKGALSVSPGSSRRHIYSILRPVGLTAAAVGVPDLMVHLIPSDSWSGVVLSSSSSLKLRWLLPHVCAALVTWSAVPVHA